MSFPTSDVIQSELMFYRLIGIADDITTALAAQGFKAEVGHTDSLNQYVKVPIANRGAVVLMPVDRSPGAWRVAWPTSGGVVSRMWPLQTDTEILVGIIVAAVASTVESRPLPSPFVWGRVESDPITSLADELIRLGVDSANLELAPLRPADPDGWPRYQDDSLRELRLHDCADQERTLVVAYDGQHGWSVDQVMPMCGASGRLNLADALGLAPEWPCVGPDDVEVELLASLLASDTSWSTDHDENVRLLRYGPTPAETQISTKEDAQRAATTWLRWIGLCEDSERMVAEPRLPSNLELIVHFAISTVGLPTVQRYTGIAAVNGRVPVVVSRSWFSRSAQEWADSTGMLLFSIDDSGLMRPASDRASTFSPIHIGDRPRACTDPTCITIGCLFETEFCPVEKRRRSQADVLRWRLR